MSSIQRQSSSLKRIDKKRLLDVAISAMGLLVAAIPLALSAVVIKLTSSGPALFRQLRVGQHGTPFEIYKLRTMRPQDNADKITVGRSPRITPIGHILRATKIDELPQLINILKGEMSLVGPRPEVPEFVAKYPEKDRDLVLSIRPGLTDFASIRFRNENSLLAAQADPLAYYEHVILPTKLRYYRFYVSRLSVGLDLYIMFLTARCVISDLIGRSSQRRRIVR